MLKLFNHIATQLVTCTMHDIVASSLQGIKQGGIYSMERNGMEVV